jgi:tungstate transport system permease protein
VILEIALRSLQVTFSALIISAVIGIPLGAWLALAKFPARKLVIALIYTGMGFPPVVIGLVVYMFLSASGPLGMLDWLFSIPAMIVAQIILAIPLIIGLTMSSVLAIDPSLRMQLQALGATPAQATEALLYEARSGVIVGLAAGFGAIISEVGAVMLVGGNISGQTRVLTTAIVLETRQGHFAVALTLGGILLALAFAANLIMVIAQGRLEEPHE